MQKALGKAKLPVGGSLLQSLLYRAPKGAKIVPVPAGRDGYLML